MILWWLLKEKRQKSWCKNIRHFYYRLLFKNRLNCRLWYAGKRKLCDLPKGTWVRLESRSSGTKSRVLFTTWGCLQFQTLVKLLFSTKFPSYICVNNFVLYNASTDSSCFHSHSLKQNPTNSIRKDTKVIKTHDQHPGPLTLLWTNWPLSSSHLTWICCDCALRKYRPGSNDTQNTA